MNHQERLDNYLAKQDMHNAMIYFLLHQDQMTLEEKNECRRKLFWRSKL
jgi:hypothetical protein